jgi:hypothetical protein
MRKYLLATVTALALSAPAKADVIIDNHLSGTGDNVIFSGLFGLVAVGAFNGQHTGIVDFSCIGGCTAGTGFSAAANGNDIKIVNTNDLKVQVFDLSGNVLPTATDVFSLKGSGTASVIAIANEADGSFKPFTFSLGTLDLSAQSGFTLTAINGETINSFTIVTTGNITDFEHYRIDVATPRAVPGPVVGAGFPGILAGLVGLWGLNKRRRNRTQT